MPITVFLAVSLNAPWGKKELDSFDGRAGRVIMFNGDHDEVVYMLYSKATRVLGCKALRSTEYMFNNPGIASLASDRPRK
ncbi:hypothetical protein ACN38_g123 [Penicillium nordicum]|uniref:Uncharacterized protein n=1 Tax=Penicillium nordicum TaxID=229535 RepID=A0A0M8PJG9_9EURO|nr:hypothetical protein ACN38_g123 [Penicillium nordicum]